MATGYSRSPKFLKGAIIQFSAPLFIPVPNIIVFQYNPETMTRSLSPWAPPANEKVKLDPKVEDSQAQPYDPTETINLTLELDAADNLENPLLHPVAFVSGVADRIAALETLLYPKVEDALISPLGDTITKAFNAVGVQTPIIPAQRAQVPIILFFFGPGRIVPVRITTFTVEEQAYLTTLYPLRAKVSLALKVLDPASLVDDKSEAYRIAVGCYKYTMNQKRALATIRNAENGVDMSLLPF